MSKNEINIGKLKVIAKNHIDAYNNEILSVYLLSLIAVNQYASKKLLSLDQQYSIASNFSSEVVKLLFESRTITENRARELNNIIEGDIECNRVLPIFNLLMYGSTFLNANKVDKKRRTSLGNILNK